MTHSRVVLEVVTAVLLGLVSVGTTFTAYQASVLSREAADLESISQQLRDRNLTGLLSSQLSYRDDGRRVAAAFALQSELLISQDRAEEVAKQQDALVAAASPELRAAWFPWAEAGFGIENFPLEQPDYVVSMFAGPQSLQYVSFVADDLVDRVSERAQTLAAAAVIFALALFVLGVAGVLTTTRTVLILASVGAGMFVAGLVVTLVAAG